MKAVRNSLSNLLKYPSAIVGLLVILGLVFIAVYAIITNKKER